MEEINLRGLNIAILGGSAPCTEILQLLLNPDLKNLNCKILAVADSFTTVPGINYAKKKKLPVFDKYNDIFLLKNLDLILKLSQDQNLTDIRKKAVSLNIQFVNLCGSNAIDLISQLKIEQEKSRIKKKIKQGKVDKDNIEKIFDQFSKRIAKIAQERIRHFQDENLELIYMEKELNQMIHGSMIPTFIINNDHIITHWNRACEDLTGFKSYELVGTDRQWSPFRSSKRPVLADTIIDQMDEDEVSRFYKDKWKKSNLIKEAYEAEEFFPNLGENGKWIFFTAAPIKSEDGKIIGAIETLRDSTQDKKAQAKLEAQDKKLAHLYDQYHVLFNNNPNPIFIVDSLTLEILDVNNSVEEDYGYPRGEIVGKPFFDIMNAMSVDISYTPEMVALFKKKSKEGHSSISIPSREITFKAKNGDHVPVRYSTSFLHKKGKLVGCAFFFHDLTEIKQLENELVQSERLAAIGQTISGLAHCIKNILIGLKGGSYVVDIGIKNNNIKKMQDGWQTIKKNINRTSDLVANLLTYSKGRKPEYQPCKPNDIVKDVIKLIQNYETDQQVEIIQQLDPKIGEVVMDPQTIHRCLMNLLSNSMDACHEVNEADRNLTIHLKTFLKRDNLLCIEVKDNGSGMNKESQDNLFTPFFSTKGSKGTGLGLLVTAKLIEEHNGTIDVSSSLGKGTKFFLEIPFEPSEPSN